MSCFALHKELAVLDTLVIESKTLYGGVEQRSARGVVVRRSLDLYELAADRSAAGK